MASPFRDFEPDALAHVGDAEQDAQHDMRVRAARLRAFHDKTAGREWQQQDNGEWWLVPMRKG